MARDGWMNRLITCFDAPRNQTDGRARQLDPYDPRLVPYDAGSLLDRIEQASVQQAGLQQEASVHRRARQVTREVTDERGNTRREVITEFEIYDDYWEGR